MGKTTINFGVKTMTEVATNEYHVNTTPYNEWLGAVILNEKDGLIQRYAEAHGDDVYYDAYSMGMTCDEAREYLHSKATEWFRYEELP